MLPVLLAGCAPSQHTFCSLDPNEECALPQPPRESIARLTVQPKPEKQITSPITAKPEYSGTKLNTPVTPEQRKRRQVQVVEIIRNQSYTSPTRNRITHTASETAQTGKHTIQIGAYKKPESRQTVINRFPTNAPLYVFPMANEFLGLSYGLYDSHRLAMKAAVKLREAGFSDIQIRKTPSRAQGI